MSEKTEEREYTKDDFCSYCPYCKVGSVYYCPECDDEEQDLFCTKLGKNVREGLCWNEIAARHKRSDGKESGIDLIPENCPMDRYKKRKDPIIRFHPHAGEYDHLLLYDPTGVMMAQVRTEEELLDFLVQVYEHQAEGYYLMDHGVRKEITKDGNVNPPVDSFAMHALEQLAL